MAKDLLSGTDPYAAPLRDTVPYPLPVAIFGLPFVWANEATATDIFIGISIAVLVFYILNNRKPWRLLILASAPLLSAVQTGQWSPLITASWFLPGLSGLLVFVKPQTAIPIFLARFRRKDIVIGSCVLIGSLLVMPLWPLKWWQSTSDYTFTIVPILAPLGMLLLLSLFHFSKAEARLLFFLSLLPYRSIYDLTSLALIPQNAWQMFIYLIFSWIYPFSISFWGIENAHITLHLLCLIFIFISYTKDMPLKQVLFSMRYLQKHNNSQIL